MIPLACPIAVASNIDSHWLCLAIPSVCLIEVASAIDSYGFFLTIPLVRPIAVARLLTKPLCFLGFQPSRAWLRAPGFEPHIDIKLTVW